MTYEVIAPLATPLDAFGEVSRTGVGKQIGALFHRCSGLMPAIGCGEGSHLSHRQWEDLIHYTLAVADGLPVYVGCQARSTSEMKVRLSAAERMGAKSAVVAAPDELSNHSMSVLINHFADIRSSTSLPLMFYWESFISGNKLGATECAQVCEVLDPIAIKDSMRDRSATMELRSLRPDVAIYQGWEDLLDAEHSEGCIIPLALVSDSVRSLRTQKPNLPLIHQEARRLGLLDDNYVSAVKGHLVEQGIFENDHLITETEQ